MSTRTLGPGQIDVKAKFKAGPDHDLAEGEFIAYASVFGNRDSYGEVVEKGAFEQTLKDWAAGGNPIPLLWGHNFADPDYNLGYIKESVEDERGLKVHAVLDMGSPKAAQVYRLLKSGRVTQMSFAFDVIREKFVEPVEADNGDGSKTVTPGYYSLEELKLYEVSVVPIGANQETEVLAVKSAADALRAKAGRVLSAKNEDAIRATITRLQESADSLRAILPDDVDPDEDDAVEDEDQDKTSGKAAALDDVKSVESAAAASSVSLAALEALELQIAASA